MLEKTPDENESLQITMKASRLVGQASSSAPCCSGATDQVAPNGFGQGWLWMIKPNRPKVGTWKVNKSEVQGRFTK